MRVGLSRARACALQRLLQRCTLRSKVRELELQLALPRVRCTLQLLQRELVLVRLLLMLEL